MQKSELNKKKTTKASRACDIKDRVRAACTAPMPIDGRDRNSAETPDVTTPAALYDYYDE